MKPLSHSIHRRPARSEGSPYWQLPPPLPLLVLRRHPERSEGPPQFALASRYPEASASGLSQPKKKRGFSPWGKLLFALLLFAPPAHPQGCSQCRESIGQTPIRTQTAYRRAITLMVIASASVFTAGVVLLRRFR